MFRTVVLVHRYVGIALGLLMAMWCLSGVVMMYVPYPQLTDEQRIAGLQSIDWKGCCQLGESATSAPAAGPISDNTSVSSFQLEMLGDRPVLRAALVGSGRRVIDLRTGAMIESVSDEDALLAAELVAKSMGVVGPPRALGLITRDQWTVGFGRGERPLHEFAFDDPARTVLYVSNVSGKAIQVTRSSQRFWNWLGSVPHWLYPTVLRQHPAVWSQVVIWASAIGVFLTAIGLYLGIVELRRRSDGKLSSPHRGIMYWHHVPGLVFGVLVVSWTLSGLFSMNPWGMMETQRIGEDMEALSGEPPRWAEVSNLIELLASRAPEKIRSVSSAPFGGELFAIASTATGERLRLDAHGLAKPLAKDELDAAAARLLQDSPRSSWGMLGTEDAYYYGTSRQPAMLPVVRFVSDGEHAVRYYLDPVSGRLVNKVDDGSRSFRWWHSALHTFDFSAFTRSAWFRNALMLPLLLGAALVCVTGVWIGIRRLTR
ncbi:MAG: peptidase [Gammaproteobacteria bacterium]